MIDDHALGHMSFFTSDLFLSAGEKKQKMMLFCENTDLCRSPKI
ncbi:MAG TPA: hypothetical protein VHW01_19425 [Polyangiaceae bacterium]|nr:hypothetical protein [Polyangiaceae bacterium]